MPTTIQGIIQRLLLTSLLLLSSLPAQAAQAFEVGFIEAINGPQSAYLLTRDRSSIAVGIMTPLFEGDAIKVLEPSNRLRQNNTITLNFNGSRAPLTLTYADTQVQPYLVKRSGAAPRPAMKLLHSVAEKLGLMHGEQYRTEVLLATAAMGTRGASAELYIPLLEGRQTFLVAGKRAVHLAWRGGKAPYALRLVREESGAPLYQAAAIQEPRHAIAPTDLQAGRYRIELTAADDATATGRLEVVEPRMLPTLPAELARELAQSDLPDAVRQTLAATWLMDQGEGRWWFEAYQRVAPVPEAFYPARVLRARLLEGF